MDPTKLSCSAWKEEIERRLMAKEGEIGLPRKIFSSLSEYNVHQLEMMLGDDNHHYTKVKLRRLGIHREPTRHDLAEHFEAYGGSDEFRKFHCYRLVDESPASSQLQAG